MFAMIVSCGGNTKKENGTNDVKMSKIEFSETMDYDFGKIKEKSDGTYEFKFKNVGENPVIITRVKSSCGCTVPTYPKDPIAVGKEASIKIKYDTKRIGRFNKTVTVYANVENSPIVLKIRGVVEKIEDEK